MQPFHIEPALPAHARKTYSIITPLDSHFRPATCAEVECEQWMHGWVSRIDESTDLGQEQARYIRFQSGRGFREERDDNGHTVFRFEPGQQPFDDADRTHSTHRIRIDRPELFVIRGGDHRGNPTGEVRRMTATPWLDDFGEHQERLADKAKEG